MYSGAPQSFSSQGTLVELAKLGSTSQQKMKLKAHAEMALAGVVGIRGTAAPNFSKPMLAPRLLFTVGTFMESMKSIFRQ